MNHDPAPFPGAAVEAAIAAAVGAYEAAIPALARLSLQRAPVAGIALSAAPGSPPAHAVVNDGVLTGHQSMAVAPHVERLAPAAAVLCHGAGALLPMLGLDEFVLSVEGPNGGTFAWFRDAAGRREATLPPGRTPGEALRALARLRGLGLGPEARAEAILLPGAWRCWWRRPGIEREITWSAQADSIESAARLMFRRAALMSHVLHGAVPEILCLTGPEGRDHGAEAQRAMAGSADPADRAIAALVRLSDSGLEVP